MSLVRASRAALCLLLGGFMVAGLPLFGQQTSGSISGVVQDSQGAVVPGAKVTVINEIQGAVVMESVTGPEGAFLFTPLQAARYTVNVEFTGFKKYIKTGIELNANDKFALPPAVLEVGAAGEQITVEASATRLETVTAERSGLVTGTQMVDLALNGRNFTDLMKTVAGVASDNLASFNGQRTDQANYMVDGATTMDSGNNGLGNYRLNTDAIAEMKVVTNSMGAEFGRSSGAQVAVITKGGGHDFHGTGYWFHRNEGMNANTFTNNILGLPRPIYRFMTTGYNFSGPVYIPGKMNRNRDKLFFFVSHEWQRSLSPSTSQQLTMPTAAERQGDFSATRDGAGVPVTIKDPTTGQPFPGNKIPQTRFSKYGPGILNWLPLPNVSGNPSFNWLSQLSSSLPRFDELYRGDYNITDKWRMFARYLGNHSLRSDAYGSNGYGSQNLLGFTPVTMPTRAWSLLGNLATIISPTLTNEFVIARTELTLPVNPPPSGSPFLDSTAKLNIPQLYPGANKAGFVPNFSWGGIPSGTALLGGSYYTNFLGQPYFNTNPILNITDNVTKVVGSHTLKAGVFIETARKTQTPVAANTGQVAFDRDTQNPGDTNWAFSNALLGNFRTYQQLNKIFDANYLNQSFEWYVQDSWKARSNLTVNYGLRFNLVHPMYERDNLIASFNSSLYDPKQAVTLYQKTLVNGQQLALDPFTGKTAPAVLIGAIVPGHGNINNGLVQAGANGYPRGLMDSRGLQYGPRLGLVWSPGGVNGKTVVRMGGGAFYERLEGNVAYGQVNNPPVLRSAQVWYGNLANLADTAATDFPVNARGISKDGHIPTVYNYSFGIQRQLPSGFLLDASYVGSQSRHLVTSMPFNQAGWGSAWLPQNQDPTVTPKYDGTTTLPVNMYRPYLGYTGPGSIYTFGGSANYNALQVTMNRRMRNGLQVGMAYTWSKALGTASAIGGTNHPTDLRKAQYGPLSFSRTQILAVNYVYSLPNFARKGSFLDNVAGKTVLNGWQLSGIATFSSGAPDNVTYSMTGVGATLLNRQITGSEDYAPRVVMTCNPNRSGGDRTLYAFINTSCFAPAKKGSVGMDSGTGRITDPGVNNWDLSIFKKIQLGGDSGRYIQIRGESFNAFNHTQWSAFNNTAQFNATGQIVNLANAGGGRFGFGALSTNRAQRIIQIAAKLYF